MKPAVRALVVAISVVLLGGAVSAAVVLARPDDHVGAPATTVPPTSDTTATTTSDSPATTRPATPPDTVPPTTRRSPTPTTAPIPTTSPPLDTVPVTTTTTRPVLSPPEATKALCADIGVAIQMVSGGNAVGGGLRLLRAVNTYGDAADPTVVAPARRMLSAGLDGDLESSAIAAEEASSSCARLGYPFGIIRCITAPCP